MNGYDCKIHTGIVQMTFRCFHWTLQKHSSVYTIPHLLEAELLIWSELQSRSQRSVQPLVNTRLCATDCEYLLNMKLTQLRQCLLKQVGSFNEMKEMKVGSFN